MKKIIRITQPNDAPFHLTWVINNICTNQCSYCPSDLHAGKNHHYEWENAKKFLHDLFEKHERIHVTITGGEPSLSPFFKELVEMFYSNGHTIGMTSNAARTVRYWEEMSQYMSYICFSYHPEFPDIDFIEKAKVSSEITNVTVRVMMHPKFWDQTLDIYNQVLNIPSLNVEPVRVTDWFGKDREAHIYTKEQADWFNDHGYTNRTSKLRRLIKNPNITNNAYHFDDGTIDPDGHANDYINQGMTNFYEYTCEIGLKAMFVYWNGDINLGNCGVGGVIGNINDPKNIKWPIKPIVCTKNAVCHCASDVNINKWI